MFQINFLPARFATFAQAADCAVKHAQQRGGAVVRRHYSGDLVALFDRREDGTVSVRGIRTGVGLIGEWAA